MCIECPGNPLAKFDLEGIKSFEELSPKTQKGARKAIRSQFGVTKVVGKTMWKVHEPGDNPLRFRTVYYRLGKFHCDSCSNDKDQWDMCFHIAAVLLHLGVLKFPEAASSGVPSKNRNERAFTESKENMFQDFPILAKRLCEQAIWEDNKKGRRRIPEPDLLMGCLAWKLSKGNQREASSLLKDWAAKGYVSDAFQFSAISKYLSKKASYRQVDRLMLICGVTTQAFTFSMGPDGTGWQRFVHRVYRSLREGSRKKRKDERAAKAAAAQLDLNEKTVALTSTTEEKKDETPEDQKPSGHRGHMQTIVCTCYETNMPLAVYVRPIDPTTRDPEIDGDEDDDEDVDLDSIPKGEAPYFMAMMSRLMPYFPKVTEVRADKGNAKKLHYYWGKVMGIDVQIPFKSDFKPGARKGVSGRSHKAATEKYYEFESDPEAHSRKYHKRSQQEGVMNGAKLEVLPHVNSKLEIAQCTEVLIAWLVYAIKRLNYERYNRDGWEPDFAQAALEVGNQWLEPLPEAAKRYLQKDAEDIIEKEAVAILAARQAVSVEVAVNA